MGGDRFVDLVEGIGPDKPFEGKAAGAVQGDKFGDETIQVAVSLDDAVDAVAEGDE